MSRLRFGIFVLLTVAASAPAHAWGRSKSLPEPRRFIHAKEEIGPARLLVARPQRHRLASPAWGRSSMMLVPDRARALSSPHMRD